MQEVNARVGNQVRAWRERRGLSRDQLADRCAALGGHEVTAEAILNIEGRKVRGELRQRAASPWELMVLARALMIAPVQLLFPVGAVEWVTVPSNGANVQVPPEDAVRWFTGEWTTALDPDPLGQEWGRGKYDARSGLWEWYEQPESDPGPMRDVRRIERNRMVWQELAKTVRMVAGLFNEAETAAARDIYRATVRTLFSVSERWWAMLEDAKRSAKRDGARESKDLLRREQSEHDDLAATIEHLGGEDDG